MKKTNNRLEKANFFQKQPRYTAKVLKKGHIYDLVSMVMGKSCLFKLSKNRLSSVNIPLKSGTNCANKLMATG
ncbi:hypothetical protein, partial [Klebsiella variicola]|uniref:hypothetical protein n=1 Tax=Klebsiella variicola TaxID=244366 RepID=UPI001952CCFE